ncbi:GNAT family N-acetyltransferase [Corynebacterium sp.]|uniref:GNAT family N-acetyltransferase n=1 Tax=Corynebacterium sp. TaxID=1720 RepID=UPI0026E0FC82|nr:GNAT family N-acetyltransferase [Corynebacterium sp.]MDO5513339.1 GNAT family N-acetyltransferase [Corynebacterium sp.]
MSHRGPTLLPLTTDRLTLRAHTSGDAAWMHQIYSQPEVARYLLDDPWTETDAARHVEERLAKTNLDSDAAALALVIERDGTPIGDVLLWMTDIERRTAEIGWVLDPAHGGQGFAREAVAEVLRVAFEHYRLHRVTAQMDARNNSSARLASALGMRQEAHFLQDWWNKGEWTDTLVFALLSSDL